MMARKQASPFQKALTLLYGLAPEDVERVRDAANAMLAQVEGLSPTPRKRAKKKPPSTTSAGVADAPPLNRPTTRRRPRGVPAPGAAEAVGE